MYLWTLLLLVGLPVMIICLNFWWKYRRILAVATLLPCPPTTPLFGNLLCFTGGITTILNTLTNYTTQFKGLFCIWIGPLPLFIISDPDDVEVILNSSSSMEKDESYSFLKKFLGTGLLTSPVSMWKKYRRLLYPVFNPTNVHNYQLHFNEISRELSMELGGRGVIDPTETVSAAAIDAICRTIIGIGKVEEHIKCDAVHLLDRVNQLVKCRLLEGWAQIGWLFDLVYWSQIKDASRRLEWYKRLINNNIEDFKKRKNLPAPIIRERPTKHMLDLTCENPSPSFDGHKWVDEAITIAAKGSNSIVSATCSVLFTLAKHPEIQDKIRRNITEVIGSSMEVSFENLGAMPYLDYVILETLRLHCVVPFIGRRVTKDIKLSKTSASSILPTGCRVVIALGAMGWDANRFPEPQKFDPERFKDSQTADRNFLTFSGGLRNCPGKAYAMQFIKTMLIHIVREYHVTSSQKLDDIGNETKCGIDSESPLYIQLVAIKKPFIARLKKLSTN